ncbi:MAG: M2 family metallopeptidase [Deltaproteobacteria bacterium]|nr:M2 family metallopeptidase [Deltaproteobacteria bacterium]
MADKVKELARRRNRAAQKLGFKNHFEMALQLQELDSRSVLNIFDGLNKATQKPFQQKIERLHGRLAEYFKIPAEEIMPWHYDDPFAQAAPARATVDLDPFIKEKDILTIMRDFYQTIDLDIADVLERSDLFEKKGKCQHAFCINMDKKTDVRVLANIRPNSYWTSTMLHELGHAAYSKNINADLPHFLRDEAHTFATEAIAMLMERMIHHPHWLEVMLEIAPADLKTMEQDLWASLALDKLIIARWVMVVTNFEKNFYENPDQDLNGLWWRLVREFQLINKPEGRDAPDWAAKIHIASYPCYYQNYLLGELMAAQIAQMLEKEALGKPLTQTSFWNKPKVGQILKKKQFEKGCQWSWKKLVEHVTGKELGFESFVRQFA